VERVYVKSGEVHCAERPTIFKTVLGSCVSTCLWDEQLCIGGLNHYILPRGTTGSPDLRFGDSAITQLISRLSALGCSSLVAKVFGGATVMPMGGVTTVGDKNIEVAMELLRRNRIPVVAQRTGGRNGIVIQYISKSGEVQVREITDEPNLKTLTIQALRSHA
jgi:chemotaxis protein CheD